MPFMEAFEKPPIQLLQLLSFQGHEALNEATLLVTTHSMAAPAIARVLSETFYKVRVEPRTSLVVVDVRMQKTLVAGEMMCSHVFTFSIDNIFKSKFEP